MNVKGQGKSRERDSHGIVERDHVSSKSYSFFNDFGQPLSIVFRGEGSSTFYAYLGLFSPKNDPSTFWTEDKYSVIDEGTFSLFSHPIETRAERPLSMFSKLAVPENVPIC